MSVNQASAGSSQSSGATHTRQQNRTSNDSRQQRGEGPSDSRLAIHTPALFVSPFSLLRRFFDDDLASPAGERSNNGAVGAAATTRGGAIPWMPNVDVVRRGNELVVRADLPGVKPDDVAVEIGEDAITISGQLQQERVDENGSVLRLERSYGAFFREIPLPQGAMPDQAKASFKDGVLEITVPAPPEEVSRGRRVEITRGSGAMPTNDKEQR